METGCGLPHCLIVHLLQYIACQNVHFMAEIRRGGHCYMNCLFKKDSFLEKNPCRIETMRNCNVIIFMLKSSRLQDIQWHGKIRKAWRLLFQDAWHKERSISALSYGYRKTAAVEQFPQKNLTCSIAQTAAFFRCSVRLLANVCMLRDGLFCPYPGIQAYVRRPNTGGRKPRSSCHTRYFFFLVLRYLIQQSF